MKHHIRMLACGAALLAAIGSVACGGKQTMASKSAAAYDEAKKKGIPIEAAEHGGHAAEPAGVATTSTDTAAMRDMDHGSMPGMDHSSMAGMDHSAMAGMAGMDHSKMPGMEHGTSASGAHDMAGMNHSAMPGMGHGSMPRMDHSAMAGMAGIDHSKMPGMQHGASAGGTHDMAGMNHSAMPGMNRGSMPEMDHSAMPGMQHGSQMAAPIAIAPPTSNEAIAQTQPAVTLRPDEFDAPASAAIDEAAKATSEMNHSMENIMPNSPASPQHEHPPQPKPKPPAEHHHHDGGEAS